MKHITNKFVNNCRFSWFIKIKYDFVIDCLILSGNICNIKARDARTEYLKWLFDYFINTGSRGKIHGAGLCGLLGRRFYHNINPRKHWYIEQNRQVWLKIANQSLSILDFSLEARHHLFLPPYAQEWNQKTKFSILLFLNCAFFFKFKVDLQCTVPTVNGNPMLQIHYNIEAFVINLEENCNAKNSNLSKSLTSNFRIFSSNTVWIYKITQNIM